LAVWLGFSFFHLAVSSGAAIVIGWRYPRLVSPLYLFAIAVESILSKSTDYHGQDIIQWPLIGANSLAYGAAMCLAACAWRRRGVETKLSGE
jgi:hypothetical protein